MRSLLFITYKKRLFVGYEQHIRKRDIRGFDMTEEEQAHQVKMASIYLHIKTLLDEEIEEAHITAIAGQIINLKNRMKMSTFEITLLLIKIVNDLENIIKENSEIEKIEKLLVEKEKKAKDTKTRKSGWALIEF